MIKVLTDAQITAGAAVLCDCPQPKRIGRNAAIAVFDAMCTARRATAPHAAEPAPAACTVPTEDWYCTRAPGHEGPCAAHEVESHDEASYQRGVEDGKLVARGMARLKAGAVGGALVAMPGLLDVIRAAYREGQSGGDVAGPTDTADNWRAATEYAERVIGSLASPATGALVAVRDEQPHSKFGSPELQARILEHVLPPFAAPASQHIAIVGAVARGLGAPDCRYDELDTKLVDAIVREVEAALASGFREGRNAQSESAGLSKSAAAPADPDATMWRALVRDTGATPCAFPCLRDDLSDWIATQQPSPTGEKL